jgi:hypothetical protein
MRIVCSACQKSYTLPTSACHGAGSFRSPVLHANEKLLCCSAVCVLSADNLLISSLFEMIAPVENGAIVQDRAKGVQ